MQSSRMLEEWQYILLKGFTLVFANVQFKYGETRLVDVKGCV